VPLAFHFNGSVYYQAENGGLQITQIPWDSAADFKLPVETWKRMIDAYYPYRGWLPLQRETLEAVRTYKVARGLPTYDQAVRELLDEGERDQDGGR
jgi:hypothetical protein